MRSRAPPETATLAAAAAALAEQGRGRFHSNSSALGAPRRVAMLSGLTLVLLAAWTARALEVGAALRHGRGTVGGLIPQVFSPEKPGAIEGNPLPSAPNAPARGRLAHPRLRPCPAPGTRAPARAQGAGQASGSRVSASRGRGREVAILSSDHASRPGAGN